MSADAGAVVIVGLGLIGGSLARAILAAGSRVVGVTDSEPDRMLAAAAGVDVAGAPAEIADALRAAAVVVLAVPVDRMATAADDLLPHLQNSAPVFHVGSLQRGDALALVGLARERVLGTHPLAGSAASGFAASRADLFRGATVVIESRADAGARRAAESLWRTAGATHFDYRTADEHDSLMAWISHLPQLTATALAVTLAGVDVNPCRVGPGARDTTRLAASQFELWEGILRTASPETLAALAAMEATLGTLREALAAGQLQDVGDLWNVGRGWRRAMESDA